MIKYYYQYLLESKKMVGYEELTEMDYNNLLQKNCQDYLNSKNKFWRSINLDNPYYYYDSQHDYTRKSINTKNYYTIMIDSIFKYNWEDYPLRSKSLICASSIEISEYWQNKYSGNIYEVVPYDNVKIGICPDQDMWYSFENIHIHDMQLFNDYLDMLFFYYNINYMKVLDKLNYILDIPRDNFNKNVITKIKLHEFFINSNFNTLREFFDIYFTPKYNRFQLLTSKDNIYMDREIWMEGPCLLKKHIQND